MVGIPGADWHVQYPRRDADRVEWFTTPERAVEAACGFMDDSWDVYGIGYGTIDNSIGKDRIARPNLLRNEFTRARA